MKRINNRGVVLLETLIVCIFVMTIFIFIYRNTVPMMGEYAKLETFDDVDSVYAANLIKNMVVTNISTSYINDYLLRSSSYADISDCTNHNLYTDASYCTKLKDSLGISDTDILYLTRYSSTDLDAFREDINKKEKDYLFAGGELGKFRDYLKTVSNNESFYNSNNENNKIVGLYRIFISRTVPTVDGTTVKKYANIGIYKNNYLDKSINIFGKEYDVIQTQPNLTTSFNNTTDVAGLYKSIATDSGEPTYYFRGNVDNNYVTFANDTWRIVRINEDGTIRIVRDRMAQLQYNTSTGGVPNSYFQNSASIKNHLTNAYDNDLSIPGFSSKVAVGAYFCQSYKPYPTGDTVYNPTFKCEDDSNGYGKTNILFGLLTYDEVIHAGGYYNKENTNYYLYNGSNYWLMNAASSTTYSFTWGVNANGSINTKMVAETHGVRPVVVLRADTTATGSGTQADPFVVQ